LVTTGTSPDTLHTITFLGRHPVRLVRDGGQSPLSLLLAHNYRVIQEADRQWSAQTIGWAYQVANHAGLEIFAYHWHPVGRSRVTRPHLHLRGGAVAAELGKTHFPTGVVTLADVVRLLIEDFETPPRRADWAHILETAVRV